MSTNLYARLRSILPQEPVLLGLVISHDEATDTSEIQLPAGLSPTPVAIGVSTGSIIRARGRTVPVGSNALVRGGVVQSQAPDGTPSEIAVGAVVAAPLGPQGITFTGPVPAQAATVAVPFSLDLAPFISGFYPAVSWALTAGSLAGTGLALNAGTGVISGTPSGAGVIAGLVAAATDATGLTASTNAFSITVGV